MPEINCNKIVFVIIEVAKYIYNIIDIKLYAVWIIDKIKFINIKTNTFYFYCIKIIWIQFITNKKLNSKSFIRIY